MKAITLQEFIAANPQKKIKADIIERWNSRIAPRALYVQGEIGATVYLRDYGKSIAAPKCLQFGALALQNGHPEFAAGFYKKAAELMGVELYKEVSDAGNPNADLLSKVVGSAGQVFEHTYVPGFPQDMQPGRFAPMQPVDGVADQEYYIDSPTYWGQPKVDGQKLIVFATRDGVFYQSRQMKLNGAPDVDMDLALRQLASEWGNFILEGELTYLDVNGGEHRTGSQASTASNELTGQPDYVALRYVVFSCLWQEGKNHLTSYGAMVEHGFYVASELNRMTPSIFPIETARTPFNKRALVSTQKERGREGECWFDPTMPYRPGKHNDETFVRTKYLTEGKAIVVGLTPAGGNAYGSLELTTLEGKPLGNVSCGSVAQRRLLEELFVQNGPFEIEYISQGYTETGIVWHPRIHPEWIEKNLQ